MNVYVKVIELKIYVSVQKKNMMTIKMNFVKIVLNIVYNVTILLIAHSAKKTLPLIVIINVNA